MVFKCKMCGGDITKIKGSNIGKCNYCKSEMTLPDSDNEKIINLYNRANFLRMEPDFDKAKEIYENILNLDNTQLEAHWGILLCKYGVEYVDDPKTKKKVATCHRTEDKSILNDPDYKIIKKEAVGDTLELYEKEAEYIDEIQKGILSISKKEKPYDVFICYKETDEAGERTQDSVIAEDIYEKLIEQGLKVFFARITLESKLGKEYEPYIYSALKTSKVMLVVGTNDVHFNAVWVKNEWSRFLSFMKKDKSKTLIPVYSKVDAYKLPEEFSMLQAQSMDKIGAMQDLVRGVKKLVDEYDPSAIEEEISSYSDARKIGNDRYEVSIFKENLPLWYYIGVCVIVFFGGIMSVSLLFASEVNYVGVASEIMDKKIIEFHLSNFPILFLGLAFLFIGIGVLLSIINRKTFKKRKYFLISGLTSLIICYALLALYDYYPDKEYIMFYGMSLILFIIFYFLNPTWKINSSSKTIMNFEEKEIQLKKNKQIKDNFKKKEIIKIKKWCYIPLIISLLWLLSSIYSTFNKNTRTNERNTTVEQVEIYGSKYIYKDFTKLFSNSYLNDSEERSNIIGYVTKGEIYDILEFVDKEMVVGDKDYYYDEYYDDMLRYLKIKTKEGIEGYIKYDEETNILWTEHSDDYKKLFVQTNDRDYSVRQLKVKTEYINIRSRNNRNADQVGIVRKDEIYTILDEKQDNYYNTNTTWYKIRTTNGIEGWIAGSLNNEEYIEIL